MFRNILQSVFTKGFVAVINFLILIISARYLGVESRGEINILVINITVIQILCEVYTGYSLIYFIPKYDLKKIFLTGIGFTFLACALGNTIFFFLQKQLPGQEWLSAFISLLVILNTFNCVLILGKEKIGLYNFLSLLQPLLLFLGLLFSIFVLRNYTLASFLWPMLFSFVLSFLISFGAALKIVALRTKNLEYQHKPIFAYGLICQLGVLMYIMSNKYSYYLLPTKNEVGLYGTASSLIESILIIANGISPVLLAKVVNSGNTQKNIQLTLALSKASFFFSTIAVAVLFILPNTVFVSILGEGYSDVKYYMLFYAPGILIMSFISIINNYFSAVGQLKKVLLSNSFGFVSTLILSPILIRHFGIKGAALTADISYAITAIFISVLFFKGNAIPFSDLLSIKKDLQDIKALISKKRKD
jgi:O-antigen/teichoic acid export membrane protein